MAVISQHLLTPAAESSKMLVKPAHIMVHLRLAESKFLGRRLINLHFKQAFQVIPKYMKFEKNGFGLSLSLENVNQTPPYLLAASHYLMY